MSELVTMQIYVITHKVFSNRFVWASSIKSANSFARKIYPTESYSVRESTPQEWDYMHTKLVECAG
jgi:hypothetical protein